MTTNTLGRWSPEIETWWGHLSEQEQIVWALQVNEDDGFPDGPVSIAQNPWKWAIDAYYLAQREDFADAGHPDFERVQAEADVRRAEMKEPA